MAAPKGWLAGVIAVFVVAGACNNGDDAKPVAAGPTTTASVPVAPASPTPTNCYGDPSQPYTGVTGCVPGELVTVATVLDAATMRLTDGRTVRLAGVVVPAPNSCAGPAATAETRRQVQNLTVNLHALGQRDPFGNEWVHLQVGSYYGTDLGNDLTGKGWAREYQDSPANGQYLSTIASSEQLARSLHYGQFGPPCGPPMPTFDPGPASGSTGSGPHVDVDVDRHHNMPDGALTGGYCRKKWWC